MVYTSGIYAIWELCTPNTEIVQYYVFYDSTLRKHLAPTVEHILSRIIWINISHVLLLLNEYTRIVSLHCIDVSRQTRISYTLHSIKYLNSASVSATGITVWNFRESELLWTFRNDLSWDRITNTCTVYSIISIMCSCAYTCQSLIFPFFRLFLNWCMCCAGQPLEHTKWPW
jgi:hypothetical protein